MPFGDFLRFFAMQQKGIYKKFFFDHYFFHIVVNNHI